MRWARSANRVWRSTRGGHAGGVEYVSDIRGGGWGVVAARGAGEDEVGVLGPEGVSVFQAAFDRSHAEWVQRNEMTSVTEAQCALLPVEVVDRQPSQLRGGGAVQQREQPDERLVGVTLAHGPASCELGLVSDGQGAASEAWGELVGEPAGGIGEHKALVSSPAEQVTQARQTPGAVVALGKERLDVLARDRGPVGDLEVDQVVSECGDNYQALVDGAVEQGSFAAAASALVGGKYGGQVALDRGAHGSWAALQAPLTTPGGQASLLIARQQQTAPNEESLEQPGSASRAAPRTPAVGDRGEQ